MKWIIGFLITLIVAIIGNIVAIAFSSEYRSMIRTWQADMGIHAKLGNSSENISENSGEVTKLSESLERMAIGLDALSNTGTTSTWTKQQVPESSVSKTGSIIVPVASVPTTPIVPPSPPKKEFEIPLLVQAKLLPSFSPKKIENSGIFGINIFSNLEYTTYLDPKTKLKIYVFEESYSTIRSNLRLVSGVYSLNETDTFFEASFFLNSTNKKDTLIRFVASINNKAVGFEVSKADYTKLKKLFPKS